MNLQSNFNLLAVKELSQEDLINTEGGFSPQKVWEWLITYVVTEVADGVVNGLAKPCPPKTC